MTSHLCFLLLITKVMGPLLFSPLFAQCFIEPWKIGVNQKIATSAFSLSVSVSLSPLSSSRSQAESHYKRVDCNTLLHWHQPSPSASIIVQEERAAWYGTNSVISSSLRSPINLGGDGFACLAFIKQYGNVDQSWGKNLKIPSPGDLQITVYYPAVRKFEFRKIFLRS